MPKRYKIIAKIENNPDGTARCVKYRVTDLKKFTQFLDKKWAGWKWFNVYSNSGVNKGKQLANSTNNRRPKSSFVQLILLVKVHQKKEIPSTKGG